MHTCIQKYMRTCFVRACLVPPCSYLRTDIHANIDVCISVSTYTYSCTGFFFIQANMCEACPCNARVYRTQTFFP